MVQIEVNTISLPPTTSSSLALKEKGNPPGTRSLHRPYAKMPAPLTQSSPTLLSALPALYLYPLNDSFVPKHIALSTPGQRVKIGRQTNAKTTPGERNGYFDSKVLSRAHAEIWEEGGKVRLLKLGKAAINSASQDIHQGREKQQRNLHQWRTAEPRGHGERAVRSQERRYSCMSLTHSFPIAHKLFRNSVSTLLERTTRP